MDKLRKYTKYIGFSDHTKTIDTDLIASKLALSLGATCIERHFTILNENETKDGPVSINPEKLKELCEFANYDQTKQKDLIKSEYPTWKTSLGNSNRELTNEELLNRDYYRGRFASKIKGQIVNNWKPI